MPQRFHLPSGATAAHLPRRAAPVPAAGSPPAAAGGELPPFVAEIAALPLTLTDRRGRPAALGELALADLHTLRAVARRAGWIAEAPVPLRCDNCDRAWQVKPCAAFELGPYLHDELSDPELDAPFPFGQPEVVECDGAEHVIRLGPRTVAEAAPLHRALARPAGLRWTGEVVRAAGIEELDGEVEPRRIARRLQAASDALLEELGGLFEAAHYPARLTAEVRCDGCGAHHEVPVPVEREFTLHAEEAPRVGSHQPFPGPGAFEALVGEVAAPLFRRPDLGDVHLVVELGPADTDEGGAPLLGSFTPADPHALPPEPDTVRIYYRTFRNRHQQEGPYDVRAEVDETLRHELVHLGGHRAGDDPLDDEEHAELHEQVRRRVGVRAARDRVVRSALADLGAFWAATWWVWVAVALGLALTLWGEG